ncbi:hypothetical protein JW960_09800 [candidate division KSB1 bacterium]|nr:hypothetical protein [candidate division KSB1 bacterium]
MSDQTQTTIDKPTMTFLEALDDQAENKKLISRIITFVILGIAVYEELFVTNGLKDNWMELTKWCLLYYFSRSAVEKIAKYVNAKSQPQA